MKKQPIKFDAEVTVYPTFATIKRTGVKGLTRLDANNCVSFTDSVRDTVASLSAQKLTVHLRHAKK
jgi:hypothetical protein